MEETFLVHLRHLHSSIGHEFTLKETVERLNKIALIYFRAIVLQRLGILVSLRNLMALAKKFEEN